MSDVPVCLLKNKEVNTISEESNPQYEKVHKERRVSKTVKKVTGSVEL